MGPSSHCHRKSCTALTHIFSSFAPCSPFALLSLGSVPALPSASCFHFRFRSLLSSAPNSPFVSRVFPHIENYTGSGNFDPLLLSLLSVSVFPLRASFQSPRFFLACFRSSPRPISISKLPCYHAFTADLSTLSSARGLTSLRYGSLLLEVGFTLRCLQRLSRPYFASLLCRWHDNSCTSGTFTPVLSY